MQKFVWSRGNFDHGMRKKEVKEMATKSLKRSGKKAQQPRMKVRDLKPRKDLKGGTITVEYKPQKPDGSL
jgi:hypothetical protein